MKIVVNGKQQNFEKDTLQLLELIQLNKVQQPDMVSVQLNGEFVQRDQFASTDVADGDEVDFLYFMGGGQR